MNLKLKYIILLLLTVHCSLLTVVAQNDEYTVKAVMLEKMTRFIDWPEASKVNDVSKPFVISVIGENPFGTKLNIVYSTNKIKNKKVEIKYIKMISEIEGTDLLFISKKAEELLEDLIAYAKDKPILTVSDTDGYADAGVHINFYLENRKVKFEINETAVNNAGMKPSYMLLNLAKIIKARKNIH